MIANLIAETFKGISTLVAQKPWKINKMHYIISLNHLQFSKRTDTYASLDFSFFFFYLSRNRREEKLQCGLVCLVCWLLRGKQTCTELFLMASSTVSYWNEKPGKKPAGWLSGKHYLPFSSCMTFAFVGCIEGQLRDPSPVWTLAKNLKSPSYTNWEYVLDAAFFIPVQKDVFSPLCYTPPSSKGNTCHGTWKGRCLGVRTSVGLPQRAQLQQMIGSADDQR